LAILDGLYEQIRIHPTYYRSYASQIQKAISKSFMERPALIAEASRLLAALHLTGKGQSNQVQLWTTTLDLLVEDVKTAWKACSSAFEMGDHDEPKLGFMRELPSDDLKSLSEAQLRLELLLGMPPSAGIIAVFLSEPTTQAVPVPVEKLVSLVLSILSISPSSLPRQQPPPEAGLYAAQSALLSSAHVSALTLLASLPTSLYYSKTNKILSRVFRIIEKSSPAVRCVAFKALQVLDLRLDPESQTLIHCTRTCLAQIARLLKAANVANSERREEKKQTEKSNKRRKIYESDQVQFSRKKGFVEVGRDEYEACVAAINYIPFLYEGLATHLSAEHYDLAHTTALVLLGITEISFQQPDELTAASLKAMAQLVRLSRGSVLALLTTKAASLASRGLLSADRNIQEGARALSQALEFTFHPRLPPKLSLSLHGGEEKWQADDEEEVVLGRVELEEARGAKEVQAMQDILAIPADHEISPPHSIASQGHESPRRSKTASPVHLSPDPVKPLQRPNTPSIGSPTTATTSSTTANVYALPQSSSLSPERPVAKQVFGASATTSMSTSTVPAPSTSTTTASQASRASALTTTHNVTMEEDSSDDDDDAIPELDLRSSDEESDEKEEEEVDGM
jgi:hypothetical protein